MKTSKELELFLSELFDGAGYVGVHKNTKGRITLVANNGEGSMRTSCSKQGLTYKEKIEVCRGAIPLIK